MPCRDEGADAHEKNELRDKVNHLTAMLCAVCEQLDVLNVAPSDPAACKWWAEHLVSDELRRKAKAEADRQKQIRTDALAKLTPEQRRALGF